ncbi:hypothetical protein ACTI_10770 [Actinoplanes sp. OR16]|uniref:hypothetical protein n=1 Tax=Actinoplanes sp. OR16 TaxID=946334 RepID=UPI000F6F2C8D|nr:hypothetical protein [Actinoplanes sp. OR16]BBH64392.1 hypothetical protein ACTI_10770 [Actinoplanes sp. OR16]
MTITGSRDTLSARNRARRRAAGRHEPRRGHSPAGRHSAEVVKPLTPADPETPAAVVAPAAAVEPDPIQAVDASYPKRRRRARPGFLAGAVVRCCLYVGPLSVAIAATGSLNRVAWPVTAVMLVLGWGAAQALTSMGVVVAGRSGQAAAARFVGAGFASVTALWCALVWIAPDRALGPSRALAAVVGVCGLLALGSVTVALVTRSEGAVAAWFLPCWLLAAVPVAAALGAGWATVQVEVMLPGAIVAVAVRAFRPAVLSRPGRSRLTGADRRRGLSYLVIGASQAVCVTLLWQADTPFPAALPLLIAVPMLEGLIGWHTARLDNGLDSAETSADFGRHVRNVTAITLAGLLPPLAAGCGLAVAAYQLPGPLLPGSRDGVLALAAGTLLGGVFAVTFLLAARFRTGIAATLAAVPPLAAAVIALFPSPSGPLPASVAVLAAAHLAGLLIVALTAVDLRRTP